MSAAYATSAGRGRPSTGSGQAPSTGSGQAGQPVAETAQQRNQRVTEALKAAGAGVILKPSTGEHGTVFVTGRDGGPGAVPSVTLSAEHYNMVARYLQQNIPVKLRVNVQTTFYDADGGNAYNVIAELPGADPAVKDEVVMIGGHLDSWHTGVGATDNADGSATVMEAMRILKAIGARPRRTIRVALWGGEEQGLLGSKAWVAEHLAGPANAAARDTFDVYYNIDNGTGKIYGWYLQNQEEVRPIFDSWLEPLKSIGARRNVGEPVGSTDHLSFTDAGVPGFNPIQDYGNYDIRTHHTNMDTDDRLDVSDIRQAAIVMATFAYQSANADRKLPRPTQK
jgi:Zn-dependent M28 family amino/carboxypeptidase